MFQTKFRCCAFEQLHLLFNNAGIGGGGSVIANSRDQWERTFNISWYGVYFCTRFFLPLLTKANEGRIINMSGVTGFWASTPNRPGTAVSAAKFTETDLAKSMGVPYTEDTVGLAENYLAKFG
jgi:NAD(P)-dependent dehydrogenase (short-subunit alcohol dehydrogenase family)